MNKINPHKDYDELLKQFKAMRNLAQSLEREKKILEEKLERKTQDSLPKDS